jgi:hypothetical protein
MTVAESPTFHSGSLIVNAGFTEPAFELAHAGAVLHRHLFHALRDYEMDWSGLQEIVMPVGPGNWNLSVNFLGFRASFKLHVGDFQVTFVNEMLREIALIKEVLHAIEHAVLQVVPTAGFAQRELVQQIHCKLSNQGIQDRIPSYAGILPEELGAPIGQGVALYFTSPLMSAPAGVVLDRSALVDEGLYVQLRCRFDADTFDLATSCDNFQTYLTRIDRAFHLQGTLGGAA